MDTTTTQSIYLERLEPIITDIIAPAALDVDQNATFPRKALEAMSSAGMMGLISSPEVGGKGDGLRAAALVVERIAHRCASTAMIVCMHYVGTAVIDAHGPLAVRKQIAAGKHRATLAFCEAGSRSHFWAPVRAATDVANNGHVRLDANKSWATSAGQVDSYVWSSKPVDAKGASTFCLVPR